MKKIFIMFVCLFCLMSSYAQIITAEQLDTLKIRKYGKSIKWKKTAKSLIPEVTIDKDNNLVYSRIIDIDENNGIDYFELIKLCVTDKFTNPECAIKVMDKDLGCIVVQDYIQSVVKRGEFAWDIDISLKPIIKIEFKKDKIRVTCSNRYYYVSQGARTGIFKSTPENMTYYIAYQEPWEWKGNDNIPSGLGTGKALIYLHMASQETLDYFENIIKLGAYSVENDW